MDLTLYQKMIGENNSSITQAYINDTITHVNDMFSKSPSFEQMKFDGVFIDTIISHKKSNVLDLLLRPQTSLNKGIYAVYETDTYLLTEFIANEIYPKATIALCNSFLKWKDDLGVVKEYKCVIKGNTFNNDQKKDVNELIASTGQIQVLVQYNDETKTIKPNQRFIFGNSAYVVDTIDDISNVYKNKGIINLVVKAVSTTDTDDKINQVADSTGNSGWGGW
jgi:hypothetical protein